MLAFSRRDAALMLGLFAASLALRLGIARFHQFDGLYGQDAYAYYDFARLLQAFVGSGRPLEPFFWPLGYPALLALVFSVLGASALVGQAISLVLGAAIVALVYALARLLTLSHLSALVAALIVAFCGQAIQSSLVVMADIPALCWATLSAVVLVHDGRAPRGRWLALAFALLALAAITRWLYLLLAIPWLIAIWMARRPVPFRSLVMTAGVVAAIALPQAAFSLSNPYPVFDHAWVRAWSPENALRRQFTNVDGTFDYPQVNALFYAAPYYDAYYLAPVFTAFAALGLFRVARRWRDGRALLLVGWALLPYLFLAGIPYQNVRFPLIVVPAVAVLVGVGLDAVLTWLVRLGRIRWVLLAALLLAGFGMTVRATQATLGNFLRAQQRDQQAAAWAGQRISPRAIVYTTGLTLRLQHVTALDVRELYYETPQTLAANLHSELETYLLVNPWNIEYQWTGREMQRVVHWLRDERGLIEIGHFGDYYLYRLR